MGGGASAASPPSPWAASPLSRTASAPLTPSPLPVNFMFRRLLEQLISPPNICDGRDHLIWSSRYTHTHTHMWSRPCVCWLQRVCVCIDHLCTWGKITSTPPCLLQVNGWVRTGNGELSPALWESILIENNPRFTCDQCKSPLTEHLYCPFICFSCVLSPLMPLMSSSIPPPHKLKPFRWITSP